MPERVVRGVRQRFAASALNYRTLRLLGPRLPRLTGGWMPWVGLDRFPAPALPGSDWVRLRPVLAGVCGTDMALLTGRASAVLSPFASFPAVLGHEVVGQVVEAGPDAGVAVGSRVVLDPLLGCTVRGLESCSWCAAGQPGLCLRLTEGPFAPGTMLGYCSDLPGGWSEEMVAHRSQLHAVPDWVSDEVAVLVEPLAVALHGVLAAPPGDGARVLVIGGGTLGLCTLVALRLAAPGADVAVVARHPAQRLMAERLGAAAVVRHAVGAAEARAGARRYRSLAGEDVLTGGFAQVYDAVGSRHSLDAALRVAAARGRVMVVGGPAHVQRLDWTLVWTRELRVQGTYVYGREASLSGEPHTYEAALRLLESHPRLPLGDLVTHRFGLGEWRRAMATALGRGRAGALKIVFAPGKDG